MEITLRDLPWVTFLERLRKAIIRGAAGVLLLACAGWFVTEPVIGLMLSMHQAIDRLVYINVAETLFTRLKLAVALGFVAAVPWLLWQLRAVILPLVDPAHRRLTLLLVAAASLLFYGGLAFAFFVLLPVALRFFLSFTGDPVEPLLRVESVVGFAISFSLPFAVIFQLPVVLFLLGRMGLVTAQGLRRYRKYAVLAIFAVAAVLTPADVFSQFAMAVPLWVLYEVSIALIGAARSRRAAPRGG